MQLNLKKHFATLIITAFALVVALVWADAIKELLKPVLEWGDGWVGLTIVAFIVTFIAISVTLLFAWMFSKDKEVCERKPGHTWKDNECVKE